MIGVTGWQQAEAVGVVASPLLVLAGWTVNRRRQRHHAHESKDERLERIEQLLAGRPADPVTNMPGEPGFVAEVRTFMVTSNEFQERVTRELTFNGGGSLKDQVRKLTEAVNRK